MFTGSGILAGDYCAERISLNHSRIMAQDDGVQVKYLEDCHNSNEAWRRT